MFYEQDNVSKLVVCWSSTITPAEDTQVNNGQNMFLPLASITAAEKVSKHVCIKLALLSPKEQKHNSITEHVMLDNLSMFGS